MSNYTSDSFDVLINALIKPQYANVIVLKTADGKFEVLSQSARKVLGRFNSESEAEKFKIWYLFS